jgi:NitT/TauT family transport system permease protein
VIRLAQVGLLAVILISWQIAGSVSETNRLLFSTPIDVATWIWDWAQGEYGNGLTDLAVTTAEALIGWVVGVALGAVVGAAMGSSRLLSDYGAPFVALLNAIPSIAFAPIFILIFGASYESKVYFVITVTFFIAFFSVFAGIRGIDANLLRNVRMLGASPLWKLRTVYAPATLGWLLTSLRLAWAWALAAAVVAEYLGAPQGMGSLVATGQRTDDVAAVLGGIIVVALVSLVGDRLIVRVDKRLRKWRVS